MISLSDPRTQLDDLLDKMAESIQLDPSRWARMQTAYTAVNDWIKSDSQFFEAIPFEVYVQGSVAIGTAIKPLTGEEFDLDIVIHLVIDWKKYSPGKVFSELKRRLSEHTHYSSMMELKNRCVRLNYANEFHMDILIGCQELQFDKNKIVVPDRELNDWTSSNPRGYIGWFSNKANAVKISLLEKAYSLQKLPIESFKNKKPLQRAVQLIKRYRDEYFNNDDKYATSSIILTTIAGQYYNGEDSIFETVDNIIYRIRTEIHNGKGSRIKVLNPMNPLEDFTEKWDSDRNYFENFVKFCNHLFNTWQELKKGDNRINEEKLLKSTFGNNLVIEAVRKQTEFIEGTRKSGLLGVNKGSMVLTSLGTSDTTTPIRKNTFYGE